jgi:hypothetical protein
MTHAASDVLPLAVVVYPELQNLQFWRFLPSLKVPIGLQVDGTVHGSVMSAQHISTNMWFLRHHWQWFCKQMCRDKPGLNGQQLT